MTVKFNNLSAATQAAIAAEASARFDAVKAPYVTIAAKAARKVDEIAKATSDARKGRDSLWGMFRSSLSAAQNAGHSPANLQLGLEVACAEAEIPRGSYSSYVVTLAKLLGDVQSGSLALKDAEEMSIADARKRYRVATPMQAAMTALYNAVNGWTVEEIMELVALASHDEEAGDLESIAVEIVAIGERHKAERLAAEQAGEEATTPEQQQQAA